MILKNLNAGRPFASMAKQFSQTTSAGQGGARGWVFPSQLDPELAQALAAALKGKAKEQLVGPITTKNAVYILKVEAIRRNNSIDVVDIAQIAIGCEDNPLVRIPAERALNHIRANVKNQNDLKEAANSMPEAQFNLQSNIITETISPELRGYLDKLPLNQLGPTLQTENAVIAFMVVSRGTKPAPLPDRKAVAANIINQRKLLLSQQTLKKFMRRAHIEIKKASNK